MIFLPTIMSNVSVLKPYISDPFAISNLQVVVNWTWLDGVGGLIYFISLVLFVYLISKGRMIVAYTTLLIGTAVGINISFKRIVPNVEMITQNAAIEFYKGLQNEDCYVEVLGFKSYAQYFYGRKTSPESSDRKTKEELLDGELDKTAYFVAKNVDADVYRSHPNLTELYERNGFVFFKRMPD